MDFIEEKREARVKDYLPLNEESVTINCFCCDKKLAEMIILLDTKAITYSVGKDVYKLSKYIFYCPFCKAQSAEINYDHLVYYETVKPIKDIVTEKNTTKVYLC